MIICMCQCMGISTTNDMLNSDLIITNICNSSLLQEYKLCMLAETSPHHCHMSTMLWLFLVKTTLLMKLTSLAPILYMFRADLVSSIFSNYSPILIVKLDMFWANEQDIHCRSQPCWSCFEAILDRPMAELLLWPPSWDKHGIQSALAEYGWILNT